MLPIDMINDFILRITKIVDEKPLYENGVITYIENGVTKYTDEKILEHLEGSEKWFYYKVDGMWYQTTWINGDEITLSFELPK